MARRKHKSRPLVKILLALVIVIAGLTLAKNFLLQKAIERQASAVLGVKVTVESVNLQLFAGKFALNGLNVANPPGFSSPHLLHLGQIEASLQIESLTKPVIQIDAISLNNISLYYEIGQTGNNLAVLQKSLAKAEATPPAPDSKSGSRQWQIGLLQIQNASVVPNVRIGGESIGQRIDLADMQLRNLGSGKQGITNSELADIILGTLAKNAGKKLPANMVQQGLGNIGKGLRDIGKGVLGR